ncbi:hydroxyacid dehydrogenase [Limosilactobacillus sp.]|jgi:D-3-phosphoglycerate dehydrogenase|uniref:hydroxyacid dehydrogenase n=1 Tax=Limosilactobacillus sp. TaxID=2773925 RepID=UPI0025BF33E8|nr:hydroxyacid dehydrogenase [Limosilactobacillus sp.]MCH3921661.1 hydroxyacid dehydrogenase [Limosilactobacillus sp.]MCH3928432.1 hydroxyacid dehydrogenase [Limosilactobacillus sp.]
MKKVLVSEQIDVAGIELLKKHHYSVKIADGTDTPTLEKEIKDADALIIRSTELPAEVINAADHLKIIARHGVGVNNIDIQTATHNRILVTRVIGANTFAVAEYVLMMILMLSRGVERAQRTFREQRSQLKNFNSLTGFTNYFNLNRHEVRGKTLAILGLGHIGKVIAQLTQPLGMKVVAYDPYAKQQTIPIIPRLADALSQADFVSINMPLTPETQNLITLDELKKMKSSAYIINSARGGIINENDLATALRQEVIAGAAIDSYSVEPPLDNNLLFDVPNIILTPHFAGTTLESSRAQAVGAAQSIIDYFDGKLPNGAVNPDVLAK